MNPNRSCNVDELHGMTVVLETAGPKVYVGRFDQVLGPDYLIHDADVFEEGKEGPTTKAEYLAKASAWGVWAKHKDCLVPSAEVSSIRKLTDYKTPA